MSKRSYRSKVDRWLAWLLLGSLILVLGLSGLILANGATLPGLIVAGSMLGISFGVYLISWPMVYTIEDDGLLLRSGLLRIRIPFERIERAQLSRSALSSFAWSLDRIRFDYTKPNGNKTLVLISPADRIGFLREVAEASPVHSLGDDNVLTRDG